MNIQQKQYKSVFQNITRKAIGLKSLVLNYWEINSLGGVQEISFDMLKL